MMRSAVDVVCKPGGELLLEGMVEDDILSAPGKVSRYLGGILKGSEEPAASVQLVKRYGAPGIVGDNDEGVGRNELIGGEADFRERRIGVEAIFNAQGDADRGGEEEHESKEACGSELPHVSEAGTGKGGEGRDDNQRVVIMNARVAGGEDDDDRARDKPP